MSIATLMEAWARLPRQLREIAAHPLNRGQEGSALRRWLGWQVASRLSPGPIMVPFVAGTYLVGRAGETGVTGNIYYGLAEHVEMAFALRLLRPDDLFVDVGANAGSYSVLAAGACGARVVAFEPDADAMERCLLNVRLNALAERIEAHRVAVGDRIGTVEFTVGADTGNRVRPSQADDSASISVPCTTLDAVLGDREAVLIKIDVEGFEAPALTGAAETLLRPSLIALIVETNGSERAYGAQWESVPAILARAGFLPVTYDPSSNTLGPVEDGKTSGFGNTIFVRSMAAAADRLASSSFARDLRLREQPAVAA